MLSWVMLSLIELGLKSETLRTSSLVTDDFALLWGARDIKCVKFLSFIIKYYLHLQLSFPIPKVIFRAYSLESDGLLDDRFRPECH